MTTNGSGKLTPFFTWKEHSSSMSSGEHEALKWKLNVCCVTRDAHPCLKTLVPNSPVFVARYIELRNLSVHSGSFSGLCHQLFLQSPQAEMATACHPVILKKKGPLLVSLSLIELISTLSPGINKTLSLPPF